MIILALKLKQDIGLARHGNMTKSIRTLIAEVREGSNSDYTSLHNASKKALLAARDPLKRSLVVGRGKDLPADAEGDDAVEPPEEHNRETRMELERPRRYQHHIKKAYEDD